MVSDGFYGLEADFEREAAVAAMTYKDFYPRIGQHLEPEGFADPVVRLVIRALRVMARGCSKPLYLLQTLADLRKEGQVKHEDTLAVRDLADEMEPDLDAIVAGLTKAVRDRMHFQAADQAAKLLQGGDSTSVMVLLERARNLGQTVVSIGSSMGLEALESALDAEKAETLPTGITDLDHLIGGGVPRGTLGVVLGRTNSGKSMMLSQIYVSAILDRVTCAYLSLEISPHNLVRRTVAAATDVEINALGHKKGAEQARDRLAELVASGHFGLNSFGYFPARATTVREVEEWLKQEDDRLGAKVELLCLDYAALLKAAHRRAKHEELEYVVEELRRIALQRDMWIWTVNQVNAAGRDRRKISRITTEHAAGAAAVVNTADIVVSINPLEEDFVDLHVAKNRNGDTNVTAETQACEFAFGRVTRMANGFDWDSYGGSGW